MTVCRLCSTCKVSKPVSEFYADRRAKSGVSGRCKTCDKEAGYRSLKLHPRQRDRKGMKRPYWRNHGLTDMQYHGMLTDQSHRCAVCDTPIAHEVGDKYQKSTTPHIDHDHGCCPGKWSCGKCVRGLLCQKCNIALGCVNDNSKILERMVRYLNEYDS